MKLLASCCNCGHIFGRSADGTQTELRCSKCGAEIEYTVANNSVTVRMLRLSAKQQAARLKNSQRIAVRAAVPEKQAKNDQTDY